MVARRAAGFALALAAALPDAAHATEREWHLGASFDYAMLSLTSGEEAVAEHGLGGGLLARYGLTDAFDLTMSATAHGFPETGRVAPGAGVGVSYVVDVMRWIPHVGVDTSVRDVVTFRCDAAPERCAHDVRFDLGIPAGFELRIVPEAIVGVRFRYGFLFGAEGVGSALHLGLYGAFAP